MSFEGFETPESGVRPNDQEADVSKPVSRTTNTMTYRDGSMLGGIISHPLSSDLFGETRGRRREVLLDRASTYSTMSCRGQASEQGRLQI